MFFSFIPPCRWNLESLQGGRSTSRTPSRSHRRRSLDVKEEMDIPDRLLQGTTEVLLKVARLPCESCGASFAISYVKSFISVWSDVAQPMDEGSTRNPNAEFKSRAVSSLWALSYRPWLVLLLLFDVVIFVVV